MAGGAAQAPLEELRLALVLNGGVSLAVWMGGTTRELDDLVRANRRGTRDRARGRYAPVLDLARTWAAVDVIAGTFGRRYQRRGPCPSQVNENAELGALRDLWAEQGDIENLLRAPFRGSPTRCCAATSSSSRRSRVPCVASPPTSSPPRPTST